MFSLDAEKYGPENSDTIYALFCRIATLKTSGNIYQNLRDWIFFSIWLNGRVLVYEVVMGSSLAAVT